MKDYEEFAGYSRNSRKRKQSRRKPGFDDESEYGLSAGGGLRPFSDPDAQSESKLSLSDRRRPSREFRCRNCKHVIGIPESGTKQRNHCPLCLHSVHLDVSPGDRSSNCKSLMEPIAIWVRSGEWVLLHRCCGCGEIRPNRVAPDDNETLLISLAMKPIGQPAFPLYVVRDDF
ncbi:MAG: RNHCP domain-containing protein [Leptospiraceae bacterium]